jgi:hypothetical protein
LFPRDISKFAMHFIVEEIDEDTSMEELQKMMLVALVYRVLVCFYEVRLQTFRILLFIFSAASNHKDTGLTLRLCPKICFINIFFVYCL